MAAHSLLPTFEAKCDVQLAAEPLFVNPVSNLSAPCPRNHAIGKEARGTGATRRQFVGYVTSDFTVGLR